MVGSIGFFWLIEPSNLPSISVQTSPTPIPSIIKNEPPENIERNAKLQSQTDALLPLFGKMPRVFVFLKGEVINKEGNNTERGVAYTNCNNQNEPTIFVKKIFYQKANQKQLTNILKHELTHAWQCRQKIMWGHDENFRKKFKEVGGFGN